MSKWHEKNGYSFAATPKAPTTYCINCINCLNLLYTEAGLDDFVSKPVNVGLLVEALMRSHER